MNGIRPRAWTHCQHKLHGNILQRRTPALTELPLPLLALSEQVKQAEQAEGPDTRLCGSLQRLPSGLRVPSKFCRILGSAALCIWKTLVHSSYACTQQVPAVGFLPFMSVAALPGCSHPGRVVTAGRDRQVSQVAVRLDVDTPNRHLKVPLSAPLYSRYGGHSPTAILMQLA